MSNILFFLTPKKDVEFILDTFTIRQAIEKLSHHSYTAIPVLSEEGKYVSTISDIDLLKVLKDNEYIIEATEEILIKDVFRYRMNKALTIMNSMEDLFELASSQNFVPIVDDRNLFIGIIKRSDIISYMKNQILLAKE